MGKAANTSKHITVVKSAVKRLKANNEAQKKPENAEVKNHLFYIICNRANQNSILHIGLKAGKTADQVKNPKSIRNHLKKVLGDTKEASMQAVLEIKDSKEIDVKKLSSCAGQVNMKDGIFYFQITQKKGGATPKDLKKTLQLGAFKKFFKGHQIIINGDSSKSGDSITQEELEEVAEDSIDQRTMEEKLLEFKDALSTDGLDEDSLFEAMEKAGLSLRDLESNLHHLESDNSDLGSNLRTYLDTINKEFDTDEDKFEDRVQDLELAAELAIDSWDINAKYGAADVQLQIKELEQLKKECGSPSASIVFRGKVLKESHGKSILTQIEELLDAAEEALILTDFGTPEELKAMLKNSFTEKQAIEVDKRETKLKSASEAGSTLEAQGFEEKEISMPLPSDYDERYKLMMVKLLTDDNIETIEKLMKVVDLEFTSVSGDSRKAPETIIIKAHRPDTIKGKEQWIGAEHIRDTFRFKTVVKDIKQIPGIFQKLVDNKISLVKIDTDKLFKPKGFGWRIIAFDLMMPNGQIVEWYLPIEEMEAQKKKPKAGHEIFEKWRTVPVDEFEPDIANMEKIFSKIDNTAVDITFNKNTYTYAGLQSLLTKTKDQLKQYNIDKKESSDGYDEAFADARKRMGYDTEEEMKAVWNKCVADINKIASGNLTLI